MLSLLQYAKPYSQLSDYKKIASVHPEKKKELILNVQSYNKDAKHKALGKS